MNNEIVNVLKTIDSIERKLIEARLNIKDSEMKTKDANLDEKHTADYLWTWKEARVANILINDGLYKSGVKPGTPESKKKALEFAKPYAKKELDKFYINLKKEVNKMLEEGYRTQVKYIERIK